MLDVCSKVEITRVDNGFYGGFIRLHVLNLAGERPIHGAWIIEELRDRGFELSPGTLYPLLHGLESKGYLRSCKEKRNKHSARIYVLTPKGRIAFISAKESVYHLFGQLFRIEHRAKARSAPRVVSNDQDELSAPGKTESPNQQI